MNQKETKAVIKFIDCSVGRLKLFRVENKIPGPMPDVVGENRNGKAFWLEAKQIDDWPKRATTLPLKSAFQRGQQGWARAWNSWEGKAFCLLKVGDSRKYEYFLLDYMKGDLELKTKEQLMECVLAEGIETIIEYLEKL